MLPVDSGADAVEPEGGLLETKGVEYEVSVFTGADEKTLPDILLMGLLLYDSRELSAVLLAKDMIVLSAGARTAPGGIESEETVFDVEVQSEIDVDVTKGCGEAKTKLHADE